ncbi:helix-turn-helix transcriptional regulator [Amycolatopsis australiensis]|uniref:DNA-binding response regulator, NarL/FixJ family, contains REC and HTH domains n=1 Tax=Amycolatopsis australiensis TaxID=546364 RepID=A0A1K1T5D7_9PSEU|nr:LuxR C-terminal-related transcriptional regulator [Amycolatopsis australiensis]SFW91748.1 DNA-binding response regulator, NarL/FixJ family, contains REC and HTH domains [Amycolatopsis australiensis]
MDASWSNPRHVLAVVERLLSAPRPHLLQRFSEELEKLIPHRAAAMQTGDCPRSPLKVVGDEAIARAVTSAELRRLADRSEPGKPLVVDGVLGGLERRLVLFSSMPAVGKGAVLVVVPQDVELPAAELELGSQLWNVLSTDAGQRAADPGPDVLASNLAAATARAKAITDLGQTHAATLTTLLAVLRSGRLADAEARRTATDLAADALLDLKSVVDRDQALSEERASVAFAALRAQLADLVRHTEVDVDLVDPVGDASLPQDIAHTALTLTRGLVLAALDRPATTRLRASWRLEGPLLRITVRDDCPEAAGAVPARGLTERLTTLGGHWEVDAVPGWGTTVTAVLPLGVAEPPELRPLDRLNPREVEVLTGISQGLRNRQIAEQLQLSEHTVKFHVRNILGKLDVTSRGEAAALARDLRLEPVAHRSA